MKTGSIEEEASEAIAMYPDPHTDAWTLGFLRAWRNCATMYRARQSLYDLTPEQVKEAIRLLREVPMLGTNRDKLLNGGWFVDRNNFLESLKQKP